MPRITGKMGRVYLGDDATPANNLIAETFNWSLEFNIQADACGIKGEIAEQYSLGAFTGRITAERFSHSTNDDAKLADAVRDTAATAGNSVGGFSVEYVLEQVDGGSQGATIAGTGFLVSGGLNAPRGGMATDRAEILLSSLPVIS